MLLDLLLVILLIWLMFKIGFKLIHFIITLVLIGLVFVFLSTFFIPAIIILGAAIFI
ncbi:hypothetical protein [Lactobacillus corticis]|uniref:Uncharacterized protein n=1 Tax=Lactobacillus corticis TaxID=2201249 RepID=A0A916VHQ5_9LACO|nr:hypothetical protein [Lactobacillus corticis]GFZ26563.1 hypothetical protein LCB40_04430 [Lactobacillus corticis]